MHSTTRWGALVCASTMWLMNAGAAVPQISATDWPGRTVVAYVGTRVQLAVVGYNFKYQVVAANAPTTFDATGLPRGLVIDRSTGAISGRPEVAGSFAIALTAANADGASAPANVTLEVQPAPTAAPVVSAPATVDEVSVSGFIGRDLSLYVGGFLVQGTNAPTTYTASGLPAGVTFDAVNGAVIYDRNRGLPPGVFTSTVSAGNAIGTGSATVRWTIHPRLVRVTVLNSGAVYVGDIVRLACEFDAPVVVSGTPTMSLIWTGGNTVDARPRYTSGSGTTTLEFTYQPGATDAHTNPTLALFSIDPAGGMINHTSGISAVLNVPSQGTGSPPGASFSGFYLRPSAITSAASVSAEVGRAFAFTVTASNSPKTFRIVSGTLPAGLSFASDTGAITGTPTQPGTFALSIDATNGYEAPGTTPTPATLTIGVAAASTPQPPAQAVAQTIALNAPATIAVGQPVSLSATASSGLPVTLELASGSATLSGASLTATAAGTVVIRATQSGGSGYTPATTSATINATASSTPPPTNPPPTSQPPAPAAQTITFAQPGAITVGLPVALSATASSGLPVSFSLVAGNATLSGAQLTVNSTEPATVRATQAGNGSFAPATADLTVSAARAAQTIDFVSPVSSIVIGQPVALSANASSGLPVTLSVVSGNGRVEGNALTVTGPGPVVVRATQPGSDAINPASVEVTITGAVRAAQTVTIAGDTAELISDRRLVLNGMASSGLPVAFEVVSGPATVAGNTLVPTAASGVVTVRAVQAGTDAYASADATRTITIVPAGRLINLSSRVTVRAGDAGRTLIAGFVVAGEAPKRILVRGVGPALANFGVQAPLANPTVRVFDEAGRVVGENDDWAGAELAAASARVGAFGLTAGSRDAAMLLTLPPGPYSLHVAATAGEGVALAEIYDASDVPALESQQLINISTRAYVDRGEGLLAAGFVVNGSQSKRVLIRGVGPALATFGVPGVLADPVLSVFRGATVIAQNDNWQTPQAVASAAAPANAAEIAAAGQASGAFALANGSKDAAVLVDLAPGAYTATVSGANESTGAGLVEVYEIRSQP